MAEKKTTTKQASKKQVTEVKPKERPGAGQVRRVNVDTTVDDMVKWDKEGYNLKFGTDDSSFKKLTNAEVGFLSVENRENYIVAHTTFLGLDPFDMGRDYNVTPGSAGSRLQVYNKDPKMDYYWARPDKVAFHEAKGLRVCTDPDVKTARGDSGPIKTVGGERRPELVLMEQPKEVNNAKKAERKARRDLQERRNKESFVEDARRAGFNKTVFEKSTSGD